MHFLKGKRQLEKELNIIKIHTERLIRRIQKMGIKRKRRIGRPRTT